MNFRNDITIILSEGHGGLNPVTCEYSCIAGGKAFRFKTGKEYHGNGWVYEGVLNRWYADLIESTAKERGYKVVRVAKGWEDIPLMERVRRANSVTGKAVLLPIHFNASKNHRARGFEGYTTRRKNNSDDLATIIYGKMYAISRLFPEFRIRTDKLSDGDPDKEANFYEIDKSNHLNTYMEYLFFDNKEDIKFIMDEDFRFILCTYTVDAIDLYYKAH